MEVKNFIINQQDIERNLQLLKQFNQQMGIKESEEAMITRLRASAFDLHVAGLEIYHKVLNTVVQSDRTGSMLKFVNVLKEISNTMEVEYVDLCVMIFSNWGSVEKSHNFTFLNGCNDFSKMINEAFKPSRWTGRDTEVFIKCVAQIVSKIVRREL
jgi:hypothetical protein